MQQVRPATVGRSKQMQKVLAILLENGRALEWGSSMALLSLALTMALPGETTLLAGYRMFRSLGIDDATAGVVLGVIATMRIAALYINGAWRRSPGVRMIGGIAGAAIFSMMAVVFAWPFLSGQSALTTAPGIYTTLALFDALSIYRSGGDVRLAKAVFHV